MEQKQYFISVGEPWDFEGPDGQNIIKGSILSIKSDKLLVFKTKNPMKFGAFEGNILILIPRYVDDSFSDLTNGLVNVNGGILLIEYDETLDEKELEKNSKLVIIGSIREGIDFNNCAPVQFYPSKRTYRKDKT